MSTVETPGTTVEPAEPDTDDTDDDSDGAADDLEMLAFMWAVFGPDDEQDDE